VVADELDWSSLLSTLGYDALGPIWGVDTVELRALPEAEARSILRYSIELDHRGGLAAQTRAVASMPAAERLARLRRASAERDSDAD